MKFLIKNDSFKASLLLKVYKQTFFILKFYLSDRFYKLIKKEHFKSMKILCCYKINTVIVTAN